MLTELLKSALVLVVSFGVRYVLAALKVEIDEALFNTLVSAIVTFFLAQFGVEVTFRAAPSLRGK